MKKTIGKPVNWQDFESLCKELWGEIWEIPNKIKKNGRQGQEQLGVDVYGKPKGETGYWGIQAKGKDDYSSAKLRETEISNEIEKARKFIPELEVFIIATTSNKDSKIEEYVRIKDIENQKNSSFEILLYCWEDIVDLLERNPNILNNYLQGINQKNKFDFKISFNDFEENLILNPIFEKVISKKVLTNKTDSEIFLERLHSLNTFVEPFKFKPLDVFQSNKINKSWCDFQLIMENTGSSVIENWHFTIKFISGVAKLDTGSFFLPRISFTDYVDDKNKRIVYRPLDNKPLIQKCNRWFEISLLPETNSDFIIAEWELLASDFNLEGKVQIEIRPNYNEIIKLIDVNNESELGEDIEISYYIIETENDKRKW